MKVEEKDGKIIISEIEDEAKAWDKAIEVLLKKGYSHLFDDSDSCVPIVNIGTKKIVECESFFLKDGWIYVVKSWYYYFYFSPEDNYLEVEIVNKIDKIDPDEWEDYWLPMLEDYSPEDIPIIKKTYNLK